MQKLSKASLFFVTGVLTVTTLASSFAATTKPSTTKKPTPKASVKASPKASVKASPKASVKATPQPTSSGLPAPSPSASVVPVKCTKATAVPHAAIPVEAPSTSTAPGTKKFTFTTNCGDIVILADGTHAPLTVLTLMTLAQAGFYDKSLCHRLTTKNIFVVQCGDPTAAGTGRAINAKGETWGPPEENLPVSIPNNYPEGAVAMANAGSKGTSSSQFFMVYANSSLPNTYSIVGFVASGLDILKAIAAYGVVDGKTDGKPNVALEIQKVTVS